MGLPGLVCFVGFSVFDVSGNVCDTVDICSKSVWGSVVEIEE